LKWNSWCMILHLVSTCLYQICLSRLWNERTWSAYYNESVLPIIYVGLSFVCLRLVNWHLDNNLQLNQHPVQRTAHSPTAHRVKISFPCGNTVSHNTHCLMATWNPSVPFNVHVLNVLFIRTKLIFTIFV
jgi:hypothetical protein